MRYKHRESGGGGDTKCETGANSMEGKSLLRVIEDELEDERRANRALQQEVGVLRKTVAKQEKTMMALATEMDAKEDAAAQARHALQLQQAGAVALAVPYRP